MKNEFLDFGVELLGLQLFAEGDGVGEGDDNGGGDNGEGENGNGNEPASFDEFLSGAGNQAEFDRRLQKAVTTAVTNARQKWQALTDDKLSEAEKLAKMTEEEKREYKTKKLERELEDLKRKNTLSDMSKTARKMLSEEEIVIPDELLSHLVSDDAEDTKATVDAFAELFKCAVQEGVKDALKGAPPRAGGKAKVTKQQILAIQNPVERQRMIAQNLTLFQ